MKKNYYLCIIFAIALVVLLVSCSQDDDYYDSDMYTLAEMGTRMVEPPPVNNVVLSDTVFNNYPITLSRREGHSEYSYTANVYVMLYRRNGIPSVVLNNYICGLPSHTVDEVWMQKRLEGTGYLLYAKGRNSSGIEHTGFLENYVFF